MQRVSINQTGKAFATEQSLYKNYAESPHTWITSHADLFSTDSLYESLPIAVRGDNLSSENSKFSQILTERSNSKLQTFPYEVDFSVQSDTDITELINRKMRKLDIFNSKILEKEESKIMKKFKVSPLQLQVLVKLQKRIRARFLKKKFLKATRLNNFIEYRENFQMLKRCLKRFEKRHDLENSDQSLLEDMGDVMPVIKSTRK